MYGTRLLEQDQDDDDQQDYYDGSDSYVHSGLLAIELSYPTLPPKWRAQTRSE
jgi:hypothetical protein